MTDLRKNLLAFHGAMGQPVLTVPQVPTDDRVRLRARLLVEEPVETVVSMFGQYANGNNPFDCVLVDHVTRAITHGTAHEAIEAAELILNTVIKYAQVSVDLPEFIDGLADTIYVAEGSFLEFGVDSGPIHAAVQAANMAKAGGPRDEHGKVLKPAGWKPPDIAGEIERQTAEATVGKIAKERMYPPHVSLRREANLSAEASAALAAGLASAKAEPVTELCSLAEWRHADVEIFGNRSHRGRAREVDMLGAKFLEVENEDTGEIYAYGAAAVFSIRWIDDAELAARLEAGAMAKANMANQVKRHAIRDAIVAELSGTPETRKAPMSKGLILRAVEAALMPEMWGPVSFVEEFDFMLNRGQLQREGDGFVIDPKFEEIPF